MTEGNIDELTVGKPVQGKTETKAAYIIHIGGDRHNGYIEANEKGEYIPKAKDGTPLDKGMVIQFSTNKHGEHVYLNNDTIVIVPQATKKEPEAKADVKAEIKKETPAQVMTDTLNPIQQARAHGLMAAAMMIDKLHGAQVKTEQVLKLADSFFAYIVSGQK
jgi:hypothetical protein